MYELMMVMGKMGKRGKRGHIAGNERDRLVGQ